MGENSTTPVVNETRSHALALMKFFSVDVGSEMNIPNTTSNTGIQVPELRSLWCKEFIFKVVQLLTGIVCVSIYSEGLKLLTDSLITMMFPNIVFSAFLIITGVVLFSYLLGCAMPDIVMRIFNVLGMILYFSSATVTTYECAVTKIGDAEMRAQQRYLLGTSVASFFNFFIYALDAYYSVKKAVGVEVKLQAS